jgi:hypothetical protein
MITETSIEFFKNLAQYDYDNRYYDFHNNYSCEELSYSNGILLFLFKSYIDGTFLSLKFTDVKITALDLFNVKDVESLTLDNLYRGKFELNGDLIEISEEGNGYSFLFFA